ncbi:MULTISPECIES: UDP-glucuronic acid decarboxylase family protein [unclassified Thioalkalivibrio]|uniref:UDP-glucuronic acid decarboxylase family protein n=1 Tax=unclassified Thioalkalivibrio TaxID=2621013 RepID=UPI0003810066|nr:MULTISPECIES: UDP-glucuronic acid decarboxylase family protein [unclassified Thioalkalivibrio]
MPQRPRKHILVTGGAGFIGTHLCTRLLQAGHAVTCVDNFWTGSRDNLRHLAGHPQFEIIQHDITEPLRVDADEIYNLACPGSPTHYQADPIRTTRTNVLGAINMLELARCTGARILQASTSEVYGDPEQHPQTESYPGSVNPAGPRACYDEGKRCAETLFFDYHRRHGVPIRVARLFNTYGPGMRPGDGRVIPTFILAALSDEPLTVHGDGNQTRSFCHIDDLLTGLIGIMQSEDSLIGPVNLGNPEEITIGELARQILEITGSASPLIHAPALADDPKKRCPDITRARQELGWNPATPLDAGIRHTVAWYAARSASNPA